MTRVAGALILVLLVAGCGGRRGVAVTVAPNTSRWDQAIDVRVTGLHPGRSVVVAMRAVDANGVAFSSSAPFRADRHGVVDLARMAPIRRAGQPDYDMVWPMGLFASMKPTAGGLEPFYWTPGPQLFHVAVSASGRTLTTTTFRRGFGYPTPIVDRQLTAAREGIVGTYAAPRHAGRGPAVLAFGGSEGGPGPSLDAVRFASDGIPTLALGYFDAPGLPRDLEDIPLEYFRRALQWLDRQPGVDPKQVTVIGTSRGGEAALLLGVHYPALVHGVVSLVGSDYVVCGIARLGATGCIGPSWTIDGKPLPYIGTGVPNPAARIPVARIHGPVLLSCADEDQVWGSCGYASEAEHELNAAHFPYRHPLYAYANTGHFGAQIGPYEPGELLRDTFVPYDERARESLWPKILAFVRRV